MRTLPYLITAVLVWLSGSSAHAQTLAQHRCNAMEKGINISNWLEEYWNPDWPLDHKYTKQHLQQMHDAGMTSVRLPVNFHAVVDTVAPYTVDVNHEVFAWVDSVVAWTDELDMKLLIDNHHGWDLATYNWRQKLPRFSHLWSVLAQRYLLLDPDRVFFELLNEPTLAFPKDSLRIMYNDAIDSIRQHTVDHTIIVSPHFGGTAMVFVEWEPLADTNLIYTWHVYDPLDFTHQGLAWHNPYYEAGIPFPNPNPGLFDTFLTTGWQRALDWKQTHQLPIFMGEFGLSNYCDSASACQWLQYSMTRLKANYIPWFYWDWQWDFSMFRSHVISEDSIYPCFKYYLGLYGDDSFTDVQEAAQSEPMSVYPNPASEWFVLDVPFASGNVAVYDVSGRLMLQLPYRQGMRIPVSDWDAGVYLIRLFNADQVQTTRVVVGR